MTEEGADWEERFLETEETTGLCEQEEVVTDSNPVSEAEEEAGEKGAKGQRTDVCQARLQAP